MALFPQEQPLRFHEYAELNAETGTLMLSHLAYILAFWAVGRLQEEPASPRSEKPIRAQTDFPVTGFAVDIPSVPQ